MKTSIRRLDSLTHNDTAATKLINDNFEALQHGVEDALSRSGKKPNFMDDVLDMNMHRIINIADPVDDYDLANKHYVDTKVSEEETRAKAAEQALQNEIDAEERRAKAAEEAINDTLATYGNIVTHNVSEFATAAQGAKADTAVQPTDLGNGTITLTQGGVTKGTFTTNQSSNATINLDAGGSDTGIIYLHNVLPTYIGTQQADINVSSYVEDDKNYFPIVTTSHDIQIESGRNGLQDCSYVPATKNVVLRYTDNTYQRTYNVVYDVRLIPVSEVESENPFYGFRGITDGFCDLQTKDSLVTSISGSSTDAQYPSAKCVYDALQNIDGGKGIYLANQSMTFAVNSGTAFLDVSNYVENGVAYCPIVFINTPNESIVPNATYNVTNKYVYLIRNSAYSDTASTVTVYVCLIPVDSNETDIIGLSNGLYYTQFLYINKSNLVTSITSSSTDTQVPSAKCIYDTLQNIGGKIVPIRLSLNVPVQTSTRSVQVDLTTDYNVPYEEGVSYIPICSTLNSAAGYFKTIRLLKDTVNSKIKLEFGGSWQTGAPIIGESGLTNFYATCYLIPVTGSYTGDLLGVITDGAGETYQMRKDLVTSLSSSSTDTEYPSAKCVYDIVGNIETLINAL